MLSETKVAKWTRPYNKFALSGNLGLKLQVTNPQCNVTYDDLHVHMVWLYNDQKLMCS